MSRIFATIASDRVRVRFAKTPMRAKHPSTLEWVPDAWGVAWFADGGWETHREPLQPEGEGVLKEVEGRAVISHVRPDTLGPLMEENIMPFVSGGWAFAHNGMVERAAIIQLLSIDKRELRGTTDSEALFALIMQEIESRGGRDVPGAIMGATYKIEDSGAYFSSLNLVLSDGRRLYALRYARSNEKYYTLYYARFRGEAGGSFRQTMMDIRAQASSDAYAIATKPLTQDAAIIPNKSLLVIDERMSEDIIPL